MDVTINYDDRAALGDFISVDNDFLCDLIHYLDIRSILEIPVGGFRHIELFSHLAVKYIACDINKEIINSINCYINKMKYSNCIGIEQDIFKISTLDEKYECLIIMQCAFQMFNYKEMQKIIHEVDKLNIKYIVIDVHDFEIDNPYFLTKDVYLKHNQKSYIRKTRMEKKDGHYLVLHSYYHQFAIKKLLFSSKIKMYSYPIDDYIILFNKMKNFKIFYPDNLKYQYMDRLGHMNFILKRSCA